MRLFEIIQHNQSAIHDREKKKRSLLEGQNRRITHRFWERSHLSFFLAVAQTTVKQKLKKIPTKEQQDIAL